MVEVELLVLEGSMFVVSLVGVAELVDAVELEAGVVVELGGTELPSSVWHTAMSKFESSKPAALNWVQPRHLVQIVSLAMRKKELVEKRSRYAIPTFG